MTDVDEEPHPALRPAADRPWIRTAAEVLGLDESEVLAAAPASSFVALGGTSLRALEYAARMAAELDRSVSVGALLGPLPLADVAAGRPRPPAVLPDPGRRDEPTWSQGVTLRAEAQPGDAPAYLLSSADIRGPLDAGRLRAVLERLTAEHAVLRTAFVRPRRGAQDVPHRRTLSTHRPVVIGQRLPPLSDADPVEVAHGLIAASARSLLRPFQRPPIVFVTSEISAQRTVLSVLTHPALLDHGGLGRLWREVAAGYAAGPGRTDAGRRAPVPPPPADVPGAVRRRAEALAGWPQTVEIPSDLRRPREPARERARLLFGLSEQARAGCSRAQRHCGLTRNAVLCATWSLVVGRRAGVSRLVMGLLAAGNTTADTLPAAGGERLLPVGSALTGGDRSVAEYLTDVAREMGDALECAEAPFHELAAALGAVGDSSHPPLVQVAFGAHDEIVPTTLVAGEVTMDIREGPRGDITQDAVLCVRRWGTRPELALDYAPSVLRGDDAAALAYALDRTLAEIGAGLDAPLADLRTTTPEEHERLLSAGTGPALRPAGLWESVERAARAHPGTIAVRDADPARTVTYRELLEAAGRQSAALAKAGVTAGDRVAIAVRRSVREVVAVLAVLRLGASYTSLEPDMPPAVLAQVMDSARVGVVLGDERRLAALGGVLGGRTALRVGDPAGGEPRSPAAAVPPPAGVDDLAAAYLPFVPGPAAAGRSVTLPRSAIVRLAHEPRHLRAGACDRFLRMAPLSSGSSLLEIFAPLLAGGTVEVLPVGPVEPDALAEFLTVRRITGLWLDTGTFRRIADYRPDAFGCAPQLLVGGDTVPAAQVARVLRACPGTRFTATYGPAENAGLSTVLHVDDPAELTDPLPVGRPVSGGGVLILDADGRPAPAGGVGELHVYGDGSGGAGAPYRTGDLARWDTARRLRLVRRRADEITVRGGPVNLDGIAHALRGHPDVRDAVVIRTTGEELLAGVVTRNDPSLPEVLRVHAAQRLTGRAVPTLWALVDEIPRNADGTPDEARLTWLATAAGAVPRGAQTAPAAPTAAADDSSAHATTDDRAPHPDVEAIVHSAWQEVLGGGTFGRDDVLFDLGGTSVHMLRLRAVLHRRLPECGVTVQDLYRHPTIAQLAEHLAGGPTP